jgi:hypothetical protein
VIAAARDWVEAELTASPVVLKHRVDWDPACLKSFTNKECPVIKPVPHLVLVFLWRLPAAHCELFHTAIRWCGHFVAHSTNMIEVTEQR